MTTLELHHPGRPRGVGDAVLVGTDGTVNPTSWGWAWVARHGAWQAAAARHPRVPIAPGPGWEHACEQAELAAVLAAVRAFPIAPLRVVTDQQLLERFARQWVSGMSVREAWGTLDAWRPPPPELDALAAIVRGRASTRAAVSIEWYPGHRARDRGPGRPARPGHPLAHAAHIACRNAAGALRSDDQPALATVRQQVKRAVTQVQQIRLNPTAHLVTTGEN